MAVTMAAPKVPPTLESRASSEPNIRPHLPRRVLHRAANLLTPRGEPIPALAETVFELQRSQSDSTSNASVYTESSLLAQSPTVVTSSSAESDRPGIASRRYSESSGKLGLGGSIKRKLKGVTEVSTYISRSKSISKDTRQQRPSAEPTAGSISGSHENNEGNAQSGHGIEELKRRSSKSITRHFRSYSDVLWNRPRVLHTNSEPTIQTLPTTRATMVDSLPTVAIEDMDSMTAQKADNLGTLHEEPPTPLSPTSSSPLANFTVPPLLIHGLPMLKVSAKKQKRYLFRVDPDQGQILWQSKKLHIIPIENIKELRSGAEARYYREQFQLSQSCEDCWLTIIYVLDGSYKTLHLIAVTKDAFQMMDICLRKLYDVRKQLMDGLGHGEIRQAIWEKQFWKGADEEADQKLDFDDVERMCRRLNINPSRDDLLRRFNQADMQKRGYLDFNDFRRFVKSLKARPELDRIFKKVASASANAGGFINYDSFADFMRKEQKSTITESELQQVFLKYASLPFAQGSVSTHCSPAQNPLELAIQSAAITAGMNPSNFSSSPPSSPRPAATALPSSTTEISSSLASVTLTPTSSQSSVTALTHETGVMTSKAFTSFLLSPDNSVFREERHDMTKPLPDYYISSSHNTYLVGHQLVGESTVEGYIRALLHSCRSVELDIYDGDIEPVIYHGRTFTSKVPLRDICQAIARYAFVASPYPIIISAEVHCGVTQQAMIASIMSEVFGSALVKAPVDGRPKIDVLPSPEELRGRILLKAKNLYVTERDGIQEKGIVVDTESSSTETSASDTDFKEEIKQEWRKAREKESEAVRGLKVEFAKARSALTRVTSNRASFSGRSKSSSSPGTPSSPPKGNEPPKVKMSFELLALLVYTVGVKCRGINKKEVYAPEHVFSLSENTANKILKQGMGDLIKHNKTHVVRIYPKGVRIGSTNYEPHRYWSAGAQLVAINWQTFDFGYMLNHAMFQRNNRTGYVMKPPALRLADKDMFSKRTRHFLDVTVISAQQLPRPKDEFGHEIIDKSIVDPYVEVSIHIPDWTTSPFLPPTDQKRSYSPPSGASSTAATSARTVVIKTSVVKNNGFNPVWEQSLSLPFDCVGDMLDLIFVKFAVREEDSDDEPLALYCASLASLNLGYRHLPLHDAQMSQYLFSTLFVNAQIRNV